MNSNSNCIDALVSRRQGTVQKASLSKHVDSIASDVERFYLGNENYSDLSRDIVSHGPLYAFTCISSIFEDYRSRCIDMIDIKSILDFGKMLYAVGYGSSMNLFVDRICEQKGSAFANIFKEYVQK